jgi:hypothetical protein
MIRVLGISSWLLNSLGAALLCASLVIASPNIAFASGPVTCTDTKNGCANTNSDDCGGNVSSCVATNGSCSCTQKVLGKCSCNPS